MYSSSPEVQKGCSLVTLIFLWHLVGNRLNKEYMIMYVSVGFINFYEIGLALYCIHSIAF